MAGMKDRGEGFEKKFAHDAQLKFKAMARRNKLLGLWVAEKIGKHGAEADAYATEVVMSNFEEAGDEDVFRKVRGDLGDDVSDDEIRKNMETMMVTAVDQIQSD